MDTRRILIRLPNWLGDLLMARPLLHALRIARPSAFIHAVGPPASRLLEREQLWNRWSPWPVPSGDLLATASRSHGFDAALVLPPSFSSAWHVRMLRVPRRIGFATDGRSWLLTDPIPRPERGDTHQSREYLALGAPLEVTAAPLPSLTPSAEEVTEAQTRLRGLDPAGRPHAVLGPGAVYGPAKRWPPDRFVAIGQRLVARGLSVLVCGATEDQSIAKAIAAEIGPAALAVAGQTSLGEQLALCAHARVTISNDSGLAHLAAATGAPTIALFGSTSSAWTAPLGPRVQVVQHPPVCSPCFQRTCRIGYRCLTAIDVGEVERVYQELAA